MSTPVMRAHRQAYVERLKGEALSLQPRPNDEDVARFEALAEQFQACGSDEAGVAEMERIQKEAFELRDEIQAHTEAEAERRKVEAAAEAERRRLAGLPAPLTEKELIHRLALIELGKVELSEGIDPADLDLIDTDTSVS